MMWLIKGAPVISEAAAAMGGFQDCLVALLSGLFFLKTNPTRGRVGRPLSKRWVNPFILEILPSLGKHRQHAEAGKELIILKCIKFSLSFYLSHPFRFSGLIF